jgi:hypothetical protein
MGRDLNAARSADRAKQVSVPVQEHLSLELEAAEIRNAEPEPIALHPMSVPVQRSFRWTVWLLTSIGVIAIMALGFFAERRYGGEEPTLYNIPYTFVHENRVAFPVYGFWYRAAYDKLFVHPPTHYLEVGLLMKAGVPLYYAEAIPVVALSILCLLLIATARFSPAIQLGLLAGMIFGVGWVSVLGGVDFSFHLRPDAHMAFALLAGFLALQTARVQNWEPKRLFLGSFLVTYGSTLHYPALFAWAGVLFFVAFAIRDLAWRPLGGRLLIILAGGCLAGIPYLVFHLLPSLPDLQRYSEYVSTAHIRDTIRENFDVYRGLLQLDESWYFPGLIYGWPLTEALRFSVPPFAAAVGLLVWRRETRPLALSVLPFMCFLFFISSRKLSSYYHMDCVLLLIAVWVWLAIGWMKMASHLPERVQILMPPVFGCLVVGLFWVGTPEFANVRLKFHRHEFSTLRALAKNIMGPNALVASIHPLWYFSGGSEWFDLTNDLLQNPPKIDPHTYWSRFDAVAVFNEFTMGTSTGANEASLYKDGILRLRGFLESKVASEHRWVWLSPRKDRPVEGFVWRKGGLWQFRESPGGAVVVISVITANRAGLTKAFAPIEYWAMDLPKTSDNPHPPSLLFMLLERQQFDRGKPILKDEVPVEIVAGSLQAVDPNSFPIPTRQEDEIRIPRSYAEMLVSLAVPRPGSPAVPLRLSLVANDAQAERLDSGSYHIKADAVEWERLAVASIPGVVEGHDYRVTLDIQMEKGGVALQILSGKDAKVLETIYQEVPLKHASKSFVFHAPDDQPVSLSVGAWNVHELSPISVTVSTPVVQDVTLTR